MKLKLKWRWKWRWNYSGDEIEDEITIKMKCKWSWNGHDVRLIYKRDENVEENFKLVMNRMMFFAENVNECIVLL